MKRRIDEDAEADALERFSEELTFDIARDARLGDLGPRCAVLDLVTTAMSRGARISSCAEVMGMTARTMERWKEQRRRVLRAVDCLNEMRKRPRACPEAGGDDGGSI